MSKKKNPDLPVEVVVDDSVNIIESIIFTKAQNYRDVYRFRFMIQLVKVAQETIRNNFEHVLNREKLQAGDFQYAVLTIPLKSVLFNDSDNHYHQAKKSLIRFSDWVLVEESPDAFRVTPVLSFAEMRRYEGILRVEVRKNVWAKLLDFSRGYTEYNPEVILRISSPFGRQMYKGLKNQKGVVSYSIEHLKKSFGYENRYVNRDSEFISRVVEKAKVELDKVADYSFVYEVVYSHDDGVRHGRKKIKQLNFTSVRKVGNESDAAVRKMLHPAQVIGTDVYNVLTEKLYFTFSEVKANVNLFSTAVQYLSGQGLVDWLIKITPLACRATVSTQGYVINALKDFLRKKYGVIYSKNAPVKSVSKANEDVQVQPVAGQDTVSNLFKEQVTGILTGKPASGSDLGKNQYHIGDLISGSLF